MRLAECVLAIWPLQCSCLVQGGLDEAVRFRSRRPPHIRVVNQHIQDITVVVSRYRPQRCITAGGIQVSPSSVGFNINTIVWLY